jgi:hypothetical protein
MNKTKILFLGVNPMPETKLRLDYEIRAIEESLKRARQRDNFELVQKWAVTSQMLIQAVLETEPDIIHFAGHGTEDGIVLEDEIGKPKVVPTVGLNSLFKLFAAKSKCIVFNSCYSKEQAKVISRHVANVVGMNKAVPDNTAIKFATGFYQALGDGRDFHFAYKIGLVSVKLEGIKGSDIPEFWQKGQIVVTEDEEVKEDEEMRFENTKTSSQPFGHDDTLSSLFRQFIDKDDLQFVGLYTKKGELIQCESTLSNAKADIRHSKFNRIPLEQLEYYKQIGTKIPEIIDYLEQKFKHLGQGPLIRNLFDVEDGCIYYYQLTTTKYLIGITYNQWINEEDNVARCDIKMKKICNRFKNILDKEPCIHKSMEIKICKEDYSN